MSKMIITNAGLVELLERTLEDKEIKIQGHLVRYLIKDILRLQEAYKREVGVQNLYYRALETALFGVTRDANVNGGTVDRIGIAQTCREALGLLSIPDDEVLDREVAFVDEPKVRFQPNPSTEEPEMRIIKSSGPINTTDHGDVIAPGEFNLGSFKPRDTTNPGGVKKEKP